MNTKEVIERIGILRNRALALRKRAELERKGNAILIRGSFDLTKAILRLPPRARIDAAIRLVGLRVDLQESMRILEESRKIKEELSPRLICVDPKGSHVLMLEEWKAKIKPVNTFISFTITNGAAHGLWLHAVPLEQARKERVYTRDAEGIAMILEDARKLEESALQLEQELRNSQ